MSDKSDDSVLARKYLERLLKGSIKGANANLRIIEEQLGNNIYHFGLRNYRAWSKSKCVDLYRLAALGWHVHLTRVESPDSQLVALASEFLHSVRFAYWVEYFHTNMGYMIEVHKARQALVIWSAKLSKKDRALLRLEEYFEGPYEALAQNLKSFQNRDMSWKALWRLAEFFGDCGKFSDMKKVWTRVLVGLGNTTGQTVLRATINLADAHMLQGDVLEAHRMYVEIAEEEKRLNPHEVPRALIKQGRAEMIMNNTEQALNTLSSIWNGKNSFEEKSLEMYLAHALHSHTTELAAPSGTDPSPWSIIYCIGKSIDLLGGRTPRTTAMELSMVDIHRLRGDKMEAIRRGENFRILHYPMSFLCAVDSAINLAIVYRDFGMSREADDLLQEIEQFGMLDAKDLHIRLCQVKHLKSLLLCEKRAVNAAIHMLQDLLHQVGHERNNRTLLWVRLDLAQMLRHRRRNGDEAAAASLFSGMVQKRADSELSDDIDLLEEAERAIQMVRDGPYDQVGKAEEYLRGQGLCWIRESDLWLHMGHWDYLAADTTRMKPLQSKEYEEFKDGDVALW